MLVFTRKTGEVSCIGKEKDIVIKILDVQGGKVRVGIHAPREVDVVRGELLDGSRELERRE